MNEIKIFDNAEFGQIRTITKDDKPMFCLVDVCKALELSNNRIVAERLEDDERCKFNLPRQGETWFVTESGLYAAILRSDKPNAKKFRKWVTSEVLPTIRQTGTYALTSKPVLNELTVIKFIADDLRVNEASRILMYENYCKDIGMPTGFLPKYEHNGNREMKAATTLLKENGCNMSAVKFNTLLVENGYLEEKERNSSRGVTKKFKALTELGLKYGENAVSPKNQREVQPLYYADTFMELYNLLAIA